MKKRPYSLRIPHRPVLALAVTLLLSLSISAQSPQRPPKSSPEKGRIRVQVNLVNVLVNVVDKNGRPVPDLPKETFEVLEEGVPQKIEVFEAETQQPLELALMIDSSLSTIKEFAFEREAAAHFIRQVVRPGDQLAVFEFSDSVTQLTGFSADVPLLQSAVRRMREGAGTALYDAVFLGARALTLHNADRRRVLVLVTDAGETTSRADYEAARETAVRSGALLYTIVIRPVKSEGGRNTAGEHALETITDTTGGAMYYPDNVAQLDAMFDRIDRELRTQYRLGYYPLTPRKDAAFRRIEVRVKGGHVVRYRKGYFPAGEVE